MPHPASPLAFCTSPTAWRVVLALLLAVVSWLALTPKPPPEADTGWDKANHALAFTAITVAGCLSAPAAAGRAVAAAALGYGGLIEVAQTFIPGRAGEWADLAGDAVGIAAGLVLARGLRRGASRSRG